MRQFYGPAIKYPKGNWGTYCLLCRLSGSAFPRSVPAGIAGVVYVVLLQAFREELGCCSAESPFYIHPYPYQSILVFSGFLLVFRLNQSLTRYWEARTMAQTMAAKWIDAVLMCTAFDEIADKVADTHDAFCRTLVHLFSLAHAVALHAYRGDQTMTTLSARPSFAQTPHRPTPHLSWKASDIEYQRTMSGRLQGHHLAANWRNPSRERKSGLPGKKLVKQLTSTLSPMTSPRTSLTSHERKKADYNGRNPIRLIGGVHQVERELLEASPQPVHLVLSWLQRLIIARRKAGGLAADAPIVSRIHQVISDGMLGYAQALKIVDTPFPFPYAQLNAVVCLVNLGLMPIIIADKVGNEVVAAFVAFFGLTILFSLNEVARDLEDPFTTELGVYLAANRLYGPALQAEFDERILAATSQVEWRGGDKFHQYSPFLKQAVGEKFWPKDEAEPGAEAGGDGDVEKVAGEVAGEP